MKIGGNYILSRRNIAHMIVALGTALMLLCSDTTAQAKDFVNRIHDTTDSLVSIDRQMVEATCTVVPEAKYRECKSVYLEAKRYNKEHGNPVAKQVKTSFATSQTRVTYQTLSGGWRFHLSKTTANGPTIDL